jgi:hypothetical protein
MGVSYKIVNEDGTVFAETHESACYSSVQWGSFATCKTFIHRPALTRISQLTALAFYDEMKAIGFWVDDPARVVLTKAYCYPVKQTFFDSNKTSKSWMIANLVMSRMVDEFPGVIEDYLVLRTALPKADRFSLLQLAHVTTISRGYRFGSNHALVEYMWSNPKKYQTWEHVKAAYLGDYGVDAQRGTSIHQMFSYISNGRPDYDSNGVQIKYDTIDKAIKLHERICAEETKHLRSEPAVVLGPVLGPVPEGDELRAG